ncbi:hypothetical protein EVAR_98148_1 [Eumeta japonica]|uniref:Uncharacterized protein n=1 Tax=Eumeta variegata TaxID=151549 RepID=A0A4C1XTL6_EUMVA|nr:hypothetical protein EVAR_98148_1 [Eumeta japonica]
MHIIIVRERCGDLLVLYGTATACVDLVPAEEIRSGGAIQKKITVEELSERNPLRVTWVAGVFFIRVPGDDDRLRAPRAIWRAVIREARLYCAEDRTELVAHYEPTSNIWRCRVRVEHRALSSG